MKSQSDRQDDRHFFMYDCSIFFPHVCCQRHYQLPLSDCLVLQCRFVLHFPFIRWVNNVFNCQTVNAMGSTHPWQSFWVKRGYWFSQPVSSAPASAIACWRMAPAPGTRSSKSPVFLPLHTFSMHFTYCPTCLRLRPDKGEFLLLSEAHTLQIIKLKH